MPAYAYRAVYIKIHISIWLCNINTDIYISYFKRLFVDPVPHICMPVCEHYIFARVESLANYREVGTVSNSAKMGVLNIDM